MTSFYNNTISYHSDGYEVSCYLNKDRDIEFLLYQTRKPPRGFKQYTLFARIHKDIRVYEYQLSSNFSLDSVESLILRLTEHDNFISEAGLFLLESFALISGYENAIVLDLKSSLDLDTYKNPCFALLRGVDCSRYLQQERLHLKSSALIILGLDDEAKSNLDIHISHKYFSLANYDYRGSFSAFLGHVRKFSLKEYQIEYNGIDQFLCLEAIRDIPSIFALKFIEYGLCSSATRWLLSRLCIIDFFKMLPMSIHYNNSDEYIKMLINEGGTLEGVITEIDESYSVTNVLIEDGSLDCDLFVAWKNILNRAISCGYKIDDKEWMILWQELCDLKEYGRPDDFIKFMISILSLMPDAIVVQADSDELTLLERTKKMLIGGGPYKELFNAIIAREEYIDAKEQLSLMLLQ